MCGGGGGGGKRVGVGRADLILWKKYDDEDNFVVHNSLRDMNDCVNGVGWSESWDIYGWKDQKNYNGAVKELNAVVLKIVSQYQPVIQKAKAKFEKDNMASY